MSGKRDRGRPQLTFGNTVSFDNGGRPRGMHEDPLENVYEEVDDSGPGERRT